MTPVLLRDGVRPTKSQKLVMRTMLRSLLGEPHRTAELIIRAVITARWLSARFRNRALQ
jgi:hypothetical protein